MSLFVNSSPESSPQKHVPTNNPKLPPSEAINKLQGLFNESTRNPPELCKDSPLKKTKVEPSSDVKRTEVPQDQYVPKNLFGPSLKLKPNTHPKQSLPNFPLYFKPASPTKSTPHTIISSSSLSQNLPLIPLFLPLKNNDIKRDWGHSRTLPTKSMPAPQKKNPSDSKSPFKAKYDELQKGSFFYQQQSYKLSFLGKGNYSAVYSIENTNWVVKCYHGEYKSGFNQAILGKYLKSSLEYYDEMKKLGLNVADIINVDTAQTDSFIIQQKIANSVNYSDPNQLEQVVKFFEAFCEKEIVMDLQPENFREENGVVYLIDFLEEKETAKVRLITSLKAWANLFYRSNVSRLDAEKMLTQMAGAFLKTCGCINPQTIQDILDYN